MRKLPSVIQTQEQAQAKYQKKERTGSEMLKGYNPEKDKNTINFVTSMCLSLILSYLGL